MLAESDSVIVSGRPQIEVSMQDAINCGATLSTFELTTSEGQSVSIPFDRDKAGRVGDTELTHGETRQIREYVREERAQEFSKRAVAVTQDLIDLVKDGAKLAELTFNVEWDASYDRFPSNKTFPLVQHEEYQSRHCGGSSFNALSEPRIASATFNLREAQIIIRPSYHVTEHHAIEVDLGFSERKLIIEPDQTWDQVPDEVRGLCRDQGLALQDLPRELTRELFSRQTQTKVL